MTLLTNPIVQTVAIPIVVAFVVAGLLRLVGGSQRGSAVAGLSVGLGILTAYWLIFAIPDFPPIGSTNKLFYVVAFATAVGFLVDLIALPKIATRLLVALSGIAGILWIGGNTALTEPWPAGLVVVALVIVAAGGGWQVAGRPDRPVDGGAVLLVAAIGLSASAFFGFTISTAQLAGATAAALGGFLLWNWPKPRFLLGGGVLLPVIAMLAAVATQLALFTKVEAYALIPLALVFFADIATRRLQLGSGAIATALRPIVLAIVAAIPAAATVALVYLTTPQSSGYS